MSLSASGVTNPTGQTFPGLLIDDGQQPQRASIAGPDLDEVVGPQVISPLRSKPDTGPIVQPKTTSWGLAGWHLQPLPPPDPLYPFVVHIPSGRSQQGSDPPLTVATEPAGQPRRRSEPARRPEPTAHGAGSSGVAPTPGKPEARTDSLDLLLPEPT